MSFLPGMFPGAASSLGQASCTYLGYDSSTTDDNSFNYTNKSLGAAAADRLIIVCVHYAGVTDNEPVITEVTVGGVSATLGPARLENGFMSCMIAWARVPTGTTGTIYVGSDNDMTCHAITWYRATGVADTVWPDGHQPWNYDHNTGTGLDGNYYRELEIRVPIGGFAIACVVEEGSSARSHTWTNAIENRDATLEGSVAYSSAMSTTPGTYKIRATLSGSIYLNNLSMSVVSFAPQPVPCATVEFIGGAQDESPSSTQNWTNFNIGPAWAGREFCIVVFSEGEPAYDHNSVSLGGTAATLIGKLREEASYSSLSFWRVAKDTGTTGTISIVTSGTPDTTGFALYQLKNCAPGYESVALMPDSASIWLPAPPWGVVIAACNAVNDIGMECGQYSDFAEAYGWGVHDIDCWHNADTDTFEAAHFHARPGDGLNGSVDIWWEFSDSLDGVICGAVAFAPAGRFGLEAFDLSYTTNAKTVATQSAYTFAGQSIGAAARSRHVVVCVGFTGSTNRNANSVTVGGIAATKLDEISSENGDTYMRVAMFIAPVPEGTTADVVVTMSGSTGWCSVVLYRLVGAINPMYPDMAGSPTMDGNSYYADITLPSPNGRGVAFVVTDGNSAARTHTWSNSTPSGNEDCDVVVGGGMQWDAYSSARINSEPTGYSTPTVAASGSLYRGAFIAAAWG